MCFYFQKKNTRNLTVSQNLELEYKHALSRFVASILLNLKKNISVAFKHIKNRSAKLNFGLRQLLD